MKTNEEEGEGLKQSWGGGGRLIVDLRYTCIPQNISQTCRENCKKNHYKESIQDISLSVSLSYSLLLLFYVLLWELLLVSLRSRRFFLVPTTCKRLLRRLTISARADKPLLCAAY